MPKAKPEPRDAEYEERLAKLRWIVETEVGELGWQIHRFATFDKRQITYLRWKDHKRVALTEKFQCEAEAAGILTRIPGTKFYNHKFHHYRLIRTKNGPGGELTTKCWGDLEKYLQDLDLKIEEVSGRRYLHDALLDHYFEVIKTNARAVPHALAVYVLQPNPS